MLKAVFNQIFTYCRLKSDQIYKKNFEKKDLQENLILKTEKLPTKFEYIQKIEKKK